MTYVQLSEEFAGHFRKIITIIDVGKETLISCVKCIPIRTVHSRVIKFLLSLTPDMLKVISLGLCRLVYDKSFKRNGLYRRSLEIQLAKRTTGTHKIAVPAIAVGLQRTGINTGHLHFCTLIKEIAHPQGHSTIVWRNIIKTGTFIVHHGIRQVGRLEGKPHRTSIQIIQLQFQRFWLLFLIRTVLLFFILLAFQFFRLFLNGAVFTVHSELVIGLGIKESDIDIAVSAPASVAAVTSSVATKNHSLATHHPFGT